MTPLPRKVECAKNDAIASNVLGTESISIEPGQVVCFVIDQAPSATNSITQNEISRPVAKQEQQAKFGLEAVSSVGYEPKTTKEKPKEKKIIGLLDCSANLKIEPEPGLDHEHLTAKPRLVRLSMFREDNMLKWDGLCVDQSIMKVNPPSCHQEQVVMDFSQDLQSKSLIIPNTTNLRSSTPSPGHSEVNFWRAPTEDGQLSACPTVKIASIKSSPSMSIGLIHPPAGTVEAGDVQSQTDTTPKKFLNPVSTTKMYHHSCEDSLGSTAVRSNESYLEELENYVSLPHLASPSTTPMHPSLVDCEFKTSNPKGDKANKASFKAANALESKKQPMPPCYQSSLPRIAFPAMHHPKRPGTAPDQNDKNGKDSSAKSMLLQPAKSIPKAVQPKAEDGAQGDEEGMEILVERKCKMNVIELVTEVKGVQYQSGELSPRPERDDVSSRMFEKGKAPELEKRELSKVVIVEDGVKVHGIEDEMELNSDVGSERQWCWCFKVGHNQPIYTLEYNGLLCPDLPCPSQPIFIYGLLKVATHMRTGAVKT
ncbi:hypothetical protein CROQUDRAFT_707576 [Cronartium quercuum f. sp. fusiforme G11]|uniref:Uncharacterized protein n=1 Tax=Cronartium quercuum f. sp. fusiforme G11 TaxID=708437 RepID=A0A9P6NDV5_9BASI|nr:hypothetical protein CROQUDRAFT_707576 [Cronartium quercuum f. sp. fusiforme G11]